MDLNAALRELLELLADADEESRDEILEKLQALAQWIERGGFLPRVSRQQDEFFAVAT